MGEAVQAIGLLSGMGPFGKALGLVLLIAVVVVLLRRGRNEEEEKRTERQAKSLDAVQADYDEERARRIEADRKASRYLDALRIWCGFAHEQRHGRMNDRQRHIMHENKAGIEALMLPDIPTLPRLVEEDEE